MAKPLKHLFPLESSNYRFSLWFQFRYLARPAGCCNQVQIFCTYSSNYVIPVGLTVKKLANQNFAAAGGRRNEKMGDFVAGVPSSLAPSPPSPAFLLPFPLPVYACYAGYYGDFCRRCVRARTKHHSLLKRAARWWSVTLT